MIYISTFICSYIFFALSERKKGKGEKIYAILAILLLSILAGLRADCIGTDVSLYVRPFYTNASKYLSFFDFFNFFGFQSVTSDPLYFALTYFMAVIFPNYHIGFFIYEFIIIVFIYAALKKYKKMYDFSLSIGMLWICLLLYNNSLNIVRQMIAVAVVFFATTYLFEKKYKNYFFWTIIAILFHSSGILGFAILGIFILLNSTKKIENNRKQITKCIIFITLFIIALLLSQNLIKLLVNIGFLRQNYLNYLAGGSYASSGLAKSVLIGPFIYLFITGIRYHSAAKVNKNQLFFLMCTLTNFLLSFGTAISNNIIRMTYYFIPLVIMTLLLSISSRKTNKKMLYFIVTLVLFGLWIHDTVIQGYGETYPYIFYWNY